MPKEEEGIITEDKPKKGATARGFKRKREPQKPGKFAVVLHNDDYTPMEFVVLVLEKFFNKKQEEATQIMLHVHKKGIGVCGTFTYEVAESKCRLVLDFAKKNEHPLQCTMEKS